MKKSIEIINTENLFQSNQKQWEKLFFENGEYIFQSFVWVSTWWKYYKDNSKIYCILYYEEDQLIAIAPFMIKEKSLKFIGGSLNDYNTLLVTQTENNNKIFYYILNEISCFFNIVFDLIELTQIDSKLKDFLLSRIKDENIKIEEKSWEKALVINLPSTVEDYEKIISQKKLKSLQYYNKRLNVSSPLEIKFIDQKFDLKEYINWFKEHKTNLWKTFNKCEFLPDEMKNSCFFSFLEELLEKLMSKDKVLIPCLIKDGNIVSSGIYYKVNHSLVKYIQAWDYSFKSYSVGALLDWKMIEYSIKNHFIYFDLGRGDEEYKYKLGAEEIILYDLNIKNNFINI